MARQSALPTKKASKPRRKPNSKKAPPKKRTSPGKSASRLRVRSREMELSSRGDRRKESQAINDFDHRAMMPFDDNDPPRTGSHLVNLRVPLQIVDDIGFWVDNKRYKSRSEFVLAAIRFYLDYVEYRESYARRLPIRQSFSDELGDESKR